MAKWFNLSYRGYARDSPSGMIYPTMFCQVYLSNVKRDWVNSFQNQKNASYQVFINLDRMRFIMESFTGFSPQTEFLPRLFFKAFLSRPQFFDLDGIPNQSFLEIFDKIELSIKRMKA